jgi:hypothetical protein
MATRTRKPAAKKIAKFVVLHRMQFNHEDKVIYFSKSSKLNEKAYKLLPHGIVEVDGRQYQSIYRDGERYAVYQTVFVGGQCVGCNCGARNGNCKHRQQLSVIEAQRRQQTERVAERTTEPALPIVVAPLTTLPRAEAIVREAPTTEHPSIDLSTCGKLNGARGFSVMAVAL